MALDNYADLKTAIAGWLQRTDLSTNTDDFVTLLEAQCNKKLRCSNMVVRAQAPVTHEYEDLPSDYLEMITIQIPVAGTNPPDPLEYISPQEFNARTDIFTSGTPIVYTIVGSQIRLGPPPTSGTVLEMAYYAAIPALSAGVNWLITTAPDIYLYGSLIQSAPFLRDDGRISVWQTFYVTAVEALNSSNNASTHAAGPLRSRSNIGPLGGQPMNR